MMDFSTYQTEAQQSDQTPGSDQTALMVPLLGLAGEAGSLVTEFKKHLRDGDAHRLFDERIAEELGDALWYIANIASKRGLDLAEIATANLAKARSRWLTQHPGHVQLGLYQHFYDSDFPQEEQLPRELELTVRQAKRSDGSSVTVIERDGIPVGNPLTDNAHVPDGYRFHDALHLAYAAILAWSPITRSILGRKRRSKPKIDEVEDGGRATVIEEGIAALTFAYAKDHVFLDGVKRLDFDLLRTIRRMTANLEVRDRTESEWERAIFEGYKVWRAILKYEGGAIRLSMQKQSIEFVPSVSAQGHGIQRKKAKWCDAFKQ